MSIYRRKGKGKVYYMDFVHRGVRVFESTGTTDKRLARQAEARRRTELEAELTDTSRSSMSLEEAMARCYREKWASNKDASNVEARAARIVSMLGNPPLSSVDSRTIAGLRQQLKDRQMAPATINRYCALLKTVLLMAQKRWGVLDKIPYIPMDREPPGRIRVLSASEEWMLIQKLRFHTYEPYRVVAELVECLLQTGMRVGELLALDSKDVNFDHRLIHVWVNKGDRPRSIPMTQRVEQILRARCGAGRLFPVPQDLVNRAWDSVRADMRLTDDQQFVPHCLRHTCASRLVQAGVDLYTVKEVLGHSTIKVTERYAHLNPDSLRAAMDVLEPAQDGGRVVSLRNS